MRNPTLIAGAENPSPRNDERGSSLLEAVFALAFLAIGTFATLSSMVTASAADEANRERGIALRAANSQMERVKAFDYQGDLQNFVDHWNDQSNAGFDVSGLEALEVQGEAQSLGSITIDATDPQRVGVSISVDWRDRHGRTVGLVLPFTVTELSP